MADINSCSLAAALKVLYNEHIEAHFRFWERELSGKRCESGALGRVQSRVGKRDWGMNRRSIRSATNNSSWLAGIWPY